MPSIIHKQPIAEEIRKSLPKELHDLALGKGASSSGLLTQIYQLIGQTMGSLDLAFRRGKQCGIHEAYEFLVKDGKQHCAKALLKHFNMDEKGNITL